MPQTKTSGLALSLPSAPRRRGRSRGPGASTFESGQVRPRDVPDGTKLFAVNTPDARLEIFDITSGVPVHTGSVDVGLEPVAVAARTDTEVWVVNHLSDDVSIVRLTAPGPRVVDTYHLTDEPRDIVVAAGGSRVFITAAARDWLGYKGVANLPGTARRSCTRTRSRRAGSSRTSPRPSSSARRRALAVSPDGLTVYAAGFQTGNQTTTIPDGVVCDGGAPRRRARTTASTRCPAACRRRTPTSRASTARGGLIVQYNPANGHWEDELLRDWSPAVKFSLARQRRLSRSMRSRGRRARRSRTSAPSSSTW
jgi:hypothetical protein